MPVGPSTRIATWAALALCLGACSQDPASPPADGATVADLVASVAFDTTEGAVQTRAIPRPTTDGPAASVDGQQTVVNGGTATVTVTSPAPFAKVYVAGSAPISALFVPVSGFFEVAMPAPATSADLLLTFPQDLPSGPFDLFFSVVDAAGRVGSVAKLTFNALVVGTGDVQVTVAWDSDADVDLHVIDPGGQEIYWANRTSASGGQLDLDSNAACNTDNVRNENITWAVGTAPQGTYTVRVDYWSDCNVSQTNYTVLVHSEEDVSIYRGTLTGPGDQGGAGSGTQITTFTRTTGPPAAPVFRRTNPPATKGAR
jgi:hypothetical protein